jgi:purine-binding chemotaxis protein CheW
MMESSVLTPEPANAPPDIRHAEPSREEVRQIIAFRVGDEEFGLDILRVQEIIRMPQLTRVPHSAACVEGVINLRGKVIPVFNLRKRFGLAEAALDREARIVVVETGDAVLGFVVDSVSQVLTIPAASIEAPPRLGELACEYVSGVGKCNGRLVILLDLDRLMQGSEPLSSSAEPAASNAAGRLA